MEPVELEHATGSRRYAAVLLAAAIATGVAGRSFLPGLLVAVLVGVLLWGAGTLWFRTVDWRPFGTSAPPEHPSALGPGEFYDRAVKLTSVPNVPLAEAMCTELRAHGIEALCKRTPIFDALSTVTNDLEPAEIWVGEHELEEARSILQAGRGW